MRLLAASPTGAPHGIHRPLDRVPRLRHGVAPPVQQPPHEGILLVFPLWVLLISYHILIDNLRQPPPAVAASPENKR